MANVKFIKVKEGATFPTTGIIEGAIYFDENTKQIKLGGASNAITTYGGKVADALLEGDALVIKFSDGTADLRFDFSDIASASQMEVRLQALETAIAKKIETLAGDTEGGKHAISTSKTGTTGKVTLDIASGANAGNVTLTKTATGLAANVDIPVTGVVNGKDTKAVVTDKKVKVDVALSNDVTIAGGPLANNVQEAGDTWP